MKRSSIGRVGMFAAGLFVLTVGGCGSFSPRDGFGGDPATTSSNPSEPAGGTFDTPTPTPKPASTAPCPDVDVLFVVDGSGSMSDKQARLVKSFPGFTSALVKRLPSAKSVDVGVVSTSAYYDARPQECLVTKTSGPLSSNAQCFSGSSFLTTADPSLASKFACAAQVGSGGDDDEKPIRGLFGALDPKNNAPSGCNAGFSREDALLVVVLITDEDDVRDSDCDSFSGQGTCGSGGTPEEWHDKLVALKGGHPENVVVLSLLARAAGTCANAPTVKLLEFTHRFGTHGYVGDVCLDSYDGFFEKSLPLIDQACAAFVPPPR